MPRNTSTKSKELSPIEKFKKAYPFYMLGFEENKITDNQVIGDCLFCGKQNKLHINMVNGLWDCKAGDCLMSGNPAIFVQDFYEKCLQEDNEKEIKNLAEERNIPFEVLNHFGVAWNSEMDCWLIPVKNKRGTIVNLKIYIKGGKLISLAGMKLHLGNPENIASGHNEIWLTEGEWDGYTAYAMLSEEKEEAEVSWVPGANTFKQEWVEEFVGKDVIIVGDNDNAGKVFRSKTGNMLWGAAKSIKYVEWEPGLTKGYDLRDARKEGKSISDIRKLIKPYEYDNSVKIKNDNKQNDENEVELEKLDLSKRPTFKKVIETFKKWMEVNDDFERGIKILCAVNYANQLKSIPLWIHFVSPPGSGKTEILLSCYTTSTCRVLSKVTAHGLVSGFSLPGGKDPSIIPTLFGKTLILKDYTEIIQMNKAQREEVDSIFRGAYDGSVTKQFGNGITRRYEGYFNMITGVTQEIFGESRSSLGERYLVYHMIKGTGHNVDNIISAALANSGEEVTMKSEIASMVKGFLEWDLADVEIPELPEEFRGRIVSLAQVVAMLRGNVARDRENNPLYAAQYEVGTRLAKQFKLLLQGLALCNDDLKPSEYDYLDVIRVAIDSCKGFNFNIATFIAKEGGANSTQISEFMGIPKSTVKNILEDMKMLGIIYDMDEEDHTGQGRKNKVYYFTEYAAKHWERSGLILVRKTEPVEPTNGKHDKPKMKLIIKKK